MTESWFGLSPTDQGEALQVAATRSGRTAHLLEKDIWVVWALSAICRASFSTHLNFRGGTSLSKVSPVVDRFSGDIDLTYDIRKLVPDRLRQSEPLPTTTSQEKKVTSAVRERLPAWISTHVQPLLQAALAKIPSFENAVNDANLAQQAARHTSIFFAERDAHGHWIDYGQAVSGAMQLEGQDS